MDRNGNVTINNNTIPNLNTSEVFRSSIDDVKAFTGVLIQTDVTALFNSTSSPSSCTVNIPDVNFKTILLNTPGIDTNSDSEIQCSEASSFTGEINITGGFGNITDYTGLEAFTEITTLGFSASSTSISTIDLTANSKLETLVIWSMPFTSIDISTLTLLEDLNISDSDLTALDISANTALRDFRLDLGQLATIDFSGLTQLETVQMNNGLLSNVTFNNNSLLRELSFRNNQLSAINISNLPALEALNVNSNQLSALGVSQNSNLVKLSIRDNSINTLDVTQNVFLESLSIGNNNLSSLDVTQNAILLSLEIGNNNLASLDLSQNVSLDYLELIGTNPNLTVLDVSNNSNLFGFSLANSAVTAVDLSSNANLGEAFINNNANISSVNIANGNNASIIEAQFVNNPNLSCIQIDSGFTPGQFWIKDATASYSDDCTPCIVQIPDTAFKAYLVGNANINTNGNLEIECDEAVTYSGGIIIGPGTVSDLTGIESFENLTLLFIDENQITTLDLSANLSLTSIEATDNGISNVNIGANSNLEYLNLQDNSLTAFDASDLTALDLLNIRNNDLTSLNLQNGNNANLSLINVTLNLNLDCIQIDAGFTPPFTWYKDPAAVYSDNCVNLSTGSLEVVDFDVYPNPVKNELTILTQAEIKTVKVYNLVGQEMLETTTNSIKVSHLTSGIYLLHIETETGLSETKKIIKE